MLPMLHHKFNKTYLLPTNSIAYLYLIKDKYVISRGWSRGQLNIRYLFYDLSRGYGHVVDILTYFWISPIFHKLAYILDR